MLKNIKELVDHVVALLLRAWEVTQDPKLRSFLRAVIISLREAGPTEAAVLLRWVERRLAGLPIADRISAARMHFAPVYVRPTP